MNLEWVIWVIVYAKVPHHDPKLKTEMISEQDFNNDMIPTQIRNGFKTL